MGQLLGFSCEHSLTVALVCNLHTGHASPQYHVVLDDKFKTVFHDGKTSAELEKIFAELFVNSQEHFVEDSIDRPPPLDEVWLLEPELHHRHKQLKEQHDHAAHQWMVETQELKKRLEQYSPLLPDLVESDIKSDGENSLCEEPQFESGGDEIEIEERDM